MNKIKNKNTNIRGKYGEIRATIYNTKGQNKHTW